MSVTKIPGFHFCILPEGNRGEFPELDKELMRRGVSASCWDCSAGRIYRIPDSDLSKLPSDDDGPYLGDAKSGYSIYRETYEGLQLFGTQIWVDIGG